MQPRGPIPGADEQSAARPADGAGPAAGEAARAGQFAHAAFFYETPDEYGHVVGGFVAGALAAGAPVMVAVPGPNTRMIKDQLGQDADRVVFAEMTVLGLNPGRIIPAIHAFAGAHPGQLVRYVGEPMWPSRTPAEQAEAFRNEALLNVAFDGYVQILCPYDLSGLSPDVLAEAERTHPVLMRGGRSEPSRSFGSWAAEPPGSDSPLPDAPPGVEVVAYRDDPAVARNFARRTASAAGLDEPRLTDLVIAVGELAANTLRHTRAGGTICVWADRSEVICQVRDSGYIRDPLAGRRRPAADGGRGHGLWVVHQVCDLVEMRTSRSGTTFRLHFGLQG